MSNIKKNTVLFIGWNQPVVGRENLASELFNSMLGLLGDHKQKGNVDSFEPVILGTHGGDMNGFMLVKGDAEKLLQMRLTDEWMNVITQCNMAVQNFGVIEGWHGAGVEEQMKRWRNYIK